MSLDSKAAFLKLFSSRFGGQVRTVGSANWRNLSQFHQLSDAELLSSISKESKTYRALSIDETESFLLLQFESQEPERDQALWTRLNAALSLLGLSGIKLFQIAEGSTYQVYIYLAKMVKVLPLAEQLDKYLVQSGLDNVSILKPGERFVMPLQEDYRWMNDSMQPVAVRHELTEDMALNFFIGEVTKIVCCPNDLITQLEGLKDCPDSGSLTSESVQSEAEEEHVVTFLSLVPETPANSLDSIEDSADASLDFLSARSEIGRGDDQTQLIDQPALIGIDPFEEITAEEAPTEASLETLAVENSQTCLDVIENVQVECESVQVETEDCTPDSVLDVQQLAEDAALIVPAETTCVLEAIPDFVEPASNTEPVDPALEADEFELASDVLEQTSEELQQPTEIGLAGEQAPESGASIEEAIAIGNDQVESDDDEAALESDGALEEVVAVSNEAELNGAEFDAVEPEATSIQLSFPFAIGLLSTPVEPQARGPSSRRKRAPPEA
ncbi:MAG: hypothetical protein Q8T09_13500 [Candidatus Melainabacteria bacterium]|nr:hypothetical protein [Candidatus Melainabacteria bacterium]